MNHLTRGRRALVAVAALALPLTAAGPATATEGGVATHYTAAYSMDFTGTTDPGYTGPTDLGYWTCTGVRVTNPHFVRDNFTCTTTATGVTATFSDAIPWPCGCSGWISDYDGRSATRYEVDIRSGEVEGWAIYS